MSEHVTFDPELAHATNQFIAGLQDRAPLYQQGATVEFSEDPGIRRFAYEPYYNCRVIPAADSTTPPTVVLFHGMSAICHTRKIFTFDTGTQHYVKTIIDVEPEGETMAPTEYVQDAVPATAFDLGKTAGIMETLVMQQPAIAHELGDSVEAPPKWSHRLRALFTA